MNPAEHRKANAAAGEKWLRGTGAEPSALGIRACVLLALLEGGFHHIPYAKYVNWSETGCIEAYPHGGLSTYDSNALTRLVFLAHDECLRVELRGPVTGEPDDEPQEHDEDRPCGMRILITPRLRHGEIWDAHPTLEKAVALWRKKFSAELAFAESEAAA